MSPSLSRSSKAARGCSASREPVAALVETFTTSGAEIPEDDVPGVVAPVLSKSSTLSVKVAASDEDVPVSIVSKSTRAVPQVTCGSVPWPAPVVSVNLRRIHPRDFCKASRSPAGSSSRKSRATRHCRVRAVDPMVA